MSDRNNLKVISRVGKSPILVTGAHRSGTTWVGKMIALSPKVAYVSEPLNILHRPGVFSANTNYWYTYICDENEHRFLPAYHALLDYRYFWFDELKSLRSAKDLLRMTRDIYRIKRGKLAHARVLLKDPFAVFSIPWFVDKLAAQVVVVIRHPAAFVSSLKRLSWSFDFRHLLMQSRLVQDRLAAYRDQIEAAVERDDDIIVQGSLLWNLIYHSVAHFRDELPDLYCVRHEDLSLAPVNGFKQIYAYLGLKWNHKIVDAIQKNSAQGNPEELSTRNVHQVRLDSRANLMNWKKRLSAEEIERIFHLTHKVAGQFYQDEEW